MERQFVIFTVNDEEYGLDIAEISSIERMPEIFKIPNAPYYIEGLVNLRSKVLTVFNLRKHFNMPCPEFDENTKIIVAKTLSSEIGIIIDGVKEIVKIEDNSLKPAPKSRSRARDKFLAGAAEIGGRRILMLNVEKVLSEEATKSSRR